MTGDPVREQDDDVLVVRGATASYGSTTVLHPVDLEVRRGETFSLLGPNGAGKSTLLHGITGIAPLDDGLVTVVGHPASSAAAKAALGVVPDDLALPLSLSGSEVLALLARLQPGTDVAWRDHLVDALGLRPAMSKLLGEYSHGMKKKIQVVGALAHLPDLVVLDEPYRGLDPEAAVLLRELLALHTASGGGVLVATHDLLAAEQLSDRVLVVAGGRAVASGTPADLLQEHRARDLEHLFLQVSGLLDATDDVVGGLRSRWPLARGVPSAPA